MTTETSSGARRRHVHSETKGPACEANCMRACEEHVICMRTKFSIFTTRSVVSYPPPHPKIDLDRRSVAVFGSKTIEIN